MQNRYCACPDPERCQEPCDKRHFPPRLWPPPLGAPPQEHQTYTAHSMTEEEVIRIVRRELDQRLGKK